MYTAYWHLSEFPFENMTDTRFAYLSDQHREGLARLLYLVRGRKLGGVLTGPYGVGKSMILELIGHSLQTSDPDTSRFVKFDTPPGGTSAFVRRMFQAMGDPRPPNEASDALQRLDAMVSSEGTTDIESARHTVLAVDEAHLIRDPATYDFLQLLTNFRLADRDKDVPKAMFTLLLAGHDDLLQSLETQPALRQRLQLLWKLDTLDARQTAEYVQRRIQAAGGHDLMFDDEAIREIHRASRGLPRLINNICDLSLMMGCASGATQIQRDIVRQAVEDGVGDVSA